MLKKKTNTIINVDIQFFATIHNVNSEIFSRILFSRIALKYIFAMLEIHDKA